ncbi:MAG: S24/S26 family peptidase [Erythrobacter sp.]
MRVKRIADRGLEPLLPYKSLAFFRGVKSVRRSDIVLVDHPEAGRIVKKVAAVSVNGRIALRGMALISPGSNYTKSVERDEILGKLSFAMKWMRFLPRFADEEPIAGAGTDEVGIECSSGPDEDNCAATR